MTEITKKDIFDTLAEFYGKVIEPCFDRIRGVGKGLLFVVDKNKLLGYILV